MLRPPRTGAIVAADGAGVRGDGFAFGAAFLWGVAGAGGGFSCADERGRGAGNVSPPRAVGGYEGMFGGGRLRDERGMRERRLRGEFRQRLRLREREQRDGKVGTAQSQASNANQSHPTDKGDGHPIRTTFIILPTEARANPAHRPHSHSSAQHRPATKRSTCTNPAPIAHTARPIEAASSRSAGKSRACRACGKVNVGLGAQASCVEPLLGGRRQLGNGTRDTREPYPDAGAKSLRSVFS